MTQPNGRSLSIATPETREARRRPEIKLSILMPAYDEEETVLSAVRTVLDQEYPCAIELVMVDDGSRTPVSELIGEINDPRLVLHRHPANLGKGAALRQAAALASGTHMVPFDADLEYDPADLVPMLRPILMGRSEVVYGTRLFGANTRFQSYRHGLANKFLTLAANVTFDAYISDLHTCLKMMPLDLFRSFPLRESGFGLDTEITARILKTGARPFEVPVSYHSRSKAQGKKISWRDGLECLQILARVRRAPAVGVPRREPEPGVARAPSAPFRRRGAAVRSHGFVPAESDRTLVS
jgi:glycosyltransferase involved in cell wall biosynthesis